MEQRAIFFIFAVFLYNEVVFTESADPNSYVPIIKFIKSYGYAVEVHNVVTEDGYILAVHRIPGKVNEKLNETKKEKVALLMHGLLGSSATWLMTGPDRSLAFALVDRGYDVWLGNNRGNTHSQKHISKVKESFEFWNFSYHELGIYDLPKTIDYVLKSTNKKSLTYGCFSEGCTQAFVMGSLKPEYNTKIKVAVALSPAAYMTHLKGKLSLVSPFTYILSSFFETLPFAILPSTPESRKIFNHICRRGSPLRPICIFIIFSIIGPGYEESDYDKVEDYLMYEPAGCSLKQWWHFSYGQYNPGTFRQYYYGPENNLKVYNSTNPPDYLLRNVNFPIGIYHGSNDYLTPPEDVNRLAKELPNVVDHYLVPGKKLNHYDLVLGRNIRTLLYHRVLALIKQYN